MANVHFRRSLGTTDEVDRVVLVELKGKQTVEAGEMVHMHVRHENMRDACDLARGERREVAYIEQQGAMSEAKIQEDTRKTVRSPALVARDGSHCFSCSRSYLGLPIECSQSGHSWRE